MTQRFYIDSSIWMDIYEDRVGHKDEPLGFFGLRLLTLILLKKDTIVVTDTLMDELKFYYPAEKLNGMFAPFQALTEKIFATKEQKQEAEKLAYERKVPRGDALHAILSRDHDLVLVARDKHFRELEYISKHQKPEELI